MIKIADLSFKTGRVNPSGILPIAYCIAKSMIAVWPTIADDPNETDATIDKMVNYTGDFVLAKDGAWIRIYSTHGKGKATSEAQGEADGKSFINKLTLSFPTIDDNARAYAKMIVNDDYVYVVPAPGKKYFVIGSKDYPSRSTPNFDTGDATTSAHGLTISVECTDTTPLPIYKGEIVFATTSLDCLTGVETPKVVTP